MNRLSPVQHGSGREASAESRWAGPAHPRGKRGGKTDRSGAARPRRLRLRLLYMSGVRVSELAQLKWCDLMPRAKAGQITVFGKGGKTRAILPKPKTWNALSALCGAARAVDPVFRSQKGGLLGVSQIRRTMYAAAKRAGLPKKVSPHWLRQAHASEARSRSQRADPPWYRRR